MYSLKSATAGSKFRCSARAKPSREPAGEPLPFTSPLTAADREALRWYLEEYLDAPFAVYEQRAHEIRAKLATWGKALFEGVFCASTAAHAACTKARG